MSNALAHIIPPPLETTRSLADLEQIVERGLTTFVDVGRALAEISERKLYREQGFSTFEEYCAKRWGWSRETAYKYIRATDAAENVYASTQTTPSLGQARELASLPPDQQREVAENIDFSKATVRDVREAVRERQQAASAPEPVKKPRSERVAEIRDLAQQGYLLRQIAKKLNVTASYVGSLAAAEGIEFAITRQRAIDVNRVVEQTVSGAQALTFGLDELLAERMDDLDAAQIGAWVESLNESVSALVKLRKQLQHWRKHA